MLYDNFEIKGNNYEALNKIINNEIHLINNYVNMIGSGNYPFSNVLKALSSPLAINPAEGFPNKRFFPGCENLDELELYGNKLALEFFCADYLKYKVSLQPHSGTQANHIIFNSLYNKNEKNYILSMDSKSGGHVSHNFYPKKFFELINYSIDENEELDYDEIERLCEVHRPKLIIGGASSYPKQIDYARLSKIAQKYNARLLADISHTALYIANKNHISPFGFADYITMTTNKTIRGSRGGIVYYKAVYEKEIEPSIFPLTQGSPKYNEILSKIVMFQELQNINIGEYVTKILLLSKALADKFTMNGKKVYTNSTNTHIVLLDLTSETFSGKDGEEKLREIGILANRNSVPNDKRAANECSGIRFGTLALATLDIDLSDFNIIIDSIYDVLFTENPIDTVKINEIMNKLYLKN